MRFIQPSVLLLGVVMYVLLLVFADELDNYENIQWYLVIAGAWNLILLAATIIAIVDAVRRVRAKKTMQLALDSMVVKLAGVPFFVLTYLLLWIFFVAGAVILPFGGPVLWLAGVVGICLTYVAMLSTSIPVWAAIVQLRRERVIGNGLTVLYAALSLVFFTNLAAGVMLFGHSRRKPRLALMWVLLAAGMTIVGLGLLGVLGSVGVLNLAMLFAHVEESQIPAVLVASASVPTVMIVVGIAVIVVTLAVSIVRLRATRAEAQRVLDAEHSPTTSDPSDHALVD